MIRRPASSPTSRSAAITTELLSSPPMAMKRPSDRNTKTEILSAFEDLLQEKKALEMQLAAAKQLATQQLATQPPELPRNGKSAPIASPAAPILPQKMDTIVESLNQLQLNFGGAVSDLSEKLTREAAKLQTVQQSVAAETQQLQTLHNLQVIDSSLDDLLQQYETSAKAFGEEFAQQRERVEQERLQARKTWEKEQDDRRRTIQERNETTTKTQQRDVQEYNYDLALLRKLETEEYEQTKKRLYQALEDLQQAQQKQWADREKTIADHETQFAELKAKTEAMPKELEAAVKRAKEEGKGIALYQAKIKADLRSKEIDRKSVV